MHQFIRCIECIKKFTIYSIRQTNECMDTSKAENCFSKYFLSEHASVNISSGRQETRD